MTNTAIFANSRCRSAAILKIALFPYLRRVLSDFDQIWYTDTNFHSEHANLTKKSKFFKFKMADRRHIENVFFGYITVSYRPIYSKFRPEMKNHMPMQDTWPKVQFSKTEDGRRPPFWKSPYLHISAVNYPISIKFGTQMQISIPSMQIWQKNDFFQIQDGRRTPYWKPFLAIYRRRIDWLVRNLDRK